MIMEKIQKILNFIKEKLHIKNKKSIEKIKKWKEKIAEKKNKDDEDWKDEIIDDDDAKMPNLDLGKKFLNERKDILNKLFDSMYKVIPLVNSSLDKVEKNIFNKKIDIDPILDISKKLREITDMVNNYYDDNTKITIDDVYADLNPSYTLDEFEVYQDMCYDTVNEMNKKLDELYKISKTFEKQIGILRNNVKGYSNMSDTEFMNDLYKFIDNIIKGEYLIIRDAEILIQDISNLLP